MQILHVGIAAILRLSAFGLLLMSMVVLSGCGDDATVAPTPTPPVASKVVTPTPPAGGENINDDLVRALDLDRSGASGKFAPMVKKGVAMPGAYADLGTRPFDNIISSVSINPGLTDPADLKNQAGFLEYAKTSEVLNKGGERATFGFFIKVNRKYLNLDITETTEEVYFALFSYDKIKVKKGDKEEPLAAFEFFLFGPIRCLSMRNGQPEPGYDNPPYLRRGVAVSADGRLLPEVPLELAKVSNFLGKTHGDETVKPGVAQDNTGCLTCHGRDDQFPESTLPFPWVKYVPTPNCESTPTPTPTPTPTATPTPMTPSIPIPTSTATPTPSNATSDQGIVYTISGPVASVKGCKDKPPSIGNVERATTRLQMEGGKLKASLGAVTDVFNPFYPFEGDLNSDGTFHLVSGDASLDGKFSDIGSITGTWNLNTTDCQITLAPLSSTFYFGVTQIDWRKEFGVK